MKTLGLLLVLGLSAAAAQDVRPKDSNYDDDLRFITSIIPRYEVDAASPEEALKQLGRVVEKMLGEGHGILTHVEQRPDKAPPNRVQMNLHDVPATELIRYLAEISGCRLKFWGPPGAATLTLQPIDAIDDTGSFHRVQVFSVTPSGAKCLGLHSDISDQRVRDLLKDYGVEFPEGANAFWNPKTRLLAVRNSTTENSVVSGIVRLANKGFQFVRPAGNAHPSKP
jgi:hypothetical protein